MLFLNYFKFQRIMALEYLAWDVFVLEERLRRLERRVERRRLRDAQNPFELPRDEFISLFRLPQDAVMNLVNLLRAELQSERIIGLSPEIKVILEVLYLITSKLLCQ